MEIAVEPKPYFKQLLYGSSCDANFVQVEKCCFVACRDPFQKATNLEKRLDLSEKNDVLAFFGEVRSFFSQTFTTPPWIKLVSLLSSLFFTDFLSNPTQAFDKISKSQSGSTYQQDYFWNVQRGAISQLRMRSFSMSFCCYEEDDIRNLMESEDNESP